MQQFTETSLIKHSSSAVDLRLGWRFIFNDPKHTVTTTKDNSVNALDWPSQSPELNISGEIWKWPCNNVPHSTWWSLRGSAKKNRTNCPKIGVPSLQHHTQKDLRLLLVPNVLQARLQWARQHKICKTHYKRMQFIIVKHYKKPMFI